MPFSHGRLPGAAGHVGARYTSSGDGEQGTGGTMLRTISFALLAGLVCSIGIPGTVDAAPSIDLIWRSTGTPTVGSTSAAPPTTVTADVIATADAAGLSGIFISFLFDFNGFLPDENELDFVSAGELQGVKIVKGSFFNPIDPGVTLDSESNTDLVGSILGFDQATTSTAPVSQTLTIGSIVMTTNPAVANADGIDIVALVRNNGIDAVGDAAGNNVSSSTVFNGASVVPEPTSAVAGGVVLGALGLLGALRRRR